MARFEFENGFGDIMGLTEAMSKIMAEKKAFDETGIPPAFKAVHFGTVENLENLQTTEDRLSELEEKFNKLPVESDLIITSDKFSISERGIRNFGLGKALTEEDQL